MSERTNTPENNRRYEGPARLLSNNHNEEELRSRVPMHGRYQDFLTRKYGPEGTGWAFDTEDPKHDTYNQQKNASHHPEFKLATEGLINSIWGTGRYETYDGIDVSGMQRYVRDPDMGNIVVYPDGDIYAAEHNTNS